MIESLLWLSLTVYHEARNQEYLEQLAVAHTVINRSVQKSKPIKKIVLRDKQFSCYNDGIKMPDDPKAFVTSLHVAWTAMNGKDFTRGAKFYHTKKVKPKWRNTVSYIGEFGSHKFYTDMIRIKPENIKVIL